MNILMHTNDDNQGCYTCQQARKCGTFTIRWHEIGQDRHDKYTKAKSTYTLNETGANSKQQ